MHEKFHGRNFKIEHVRGPQNSFQGNDGSALIPIPLKAMQTRWIKKNK